MTDRLSVWTRVAGSAIQGFVRLFRITDELTADAAYPCGGRKGSGMRSREIACLLALLVAFGQTVVLMAAGHSGRVTLGGQAIPGAVVTVSQGERRFTTTTDIQGNYQLPDLP